MKTRAPSSEGRFAYEGLDRVIHERARLSVLTSLISSPKGVTFGELKQLCSLTDGNLSRHLRVLEEARIYLEYLSTLEQVVRDAAKGTKEEPTPGMVRGLVPARA
ncbi:MAG: transcriptional regulator [Acidobacteria bacterium]|nr:MAG: transcriptional regulator [Acidobacteriota bacterium]